MHTHLTPRTAGMLTLAALAAVLQGTAAGAAPGDLDPTFGNGGVAIIDDGGHEVANAMARQPDGRIVVGGTTTGGPSPDGLVYRLNPDGTRDQAFGLRRLAVPGMSLDAVYGLALQSDGKIVAAGQTTKGDDAAVWRLLPTGEPDPDFGGGDGLATFDNGGSEYFSDVAIAPGGAIVATGHTSVSGGLAAIYRLKPDGTPDQTFDSDGKLGVGDAASRGYAVAVQPDGKVLVAGYFGGSGAYGLRVRRFLVDGDEDTEFGEGDGEAAAFGLRGWSSDLVVQPDGRIVVTGTHSGGSDNDFAVVRYNTAGRVDDSFGGTPDHDGVVVSTGTMSASQSVDVLPSGAVVVVGARLVSAMSRTVAVALDPAGTLDPAFGNGGQVTLPSGTGAGLDVVAQPDGRALIATYTTTASSDASVYRLLTGSPAPTLTPDASTCQGKQATIVGTAGKDRIRGTKKADVIVALGGNDVVKGLGGNDLVCAGDGADRVVGGPGKDRLYGETGKDRLVGGTGQDRLVGGPGRDSTSQRSRSRSQGGEPAGVERDSARRDYDRGARGWPT